MDRINARGAADGAPTPTDARGPHHPRPSGAAAAQDPRPRKRRRVDGHVPPAVAAAAASAAAQLDNNKGEDGGGGVARILAPRSRRERIEEDFKILIAVETGFQLVQNGLTKAINKLTVKRPINSIIRTNHGDHAIAINH